MIRYLDEELDDVKIQTTSYGVLSIDEVEKVISGLHIAALTAEEIKTIIEKIKQILRY